MSTITLHFPLDPGVASLFVYEEGAGAFEAADISSNALDYKIDAAGNVEVPDNRFLKLVWKDYRSFAFISQIDMSAIDGLWFGIGPGRKISDEDLKLIAPMHQLKLLALSAHDVTDKGLLLLDGLTQLECLDISSCSRIKTKDLGGLGLTGLQKLTRLKSLKANDCYFNGSDLDALQALDELRQIRFDRIKNNLDAGMEHLASRPNLMQLSLASAEVSDQGIAKLATSKSLEVIDVSGINITDVSVQALSAIESLQELNLRETAIQGSNLDLLTNLLVLHIGGCKQLDNENLSKLSQLANLRTLYLNDLKRARDKSLAGISELKNLKELHMLGCTYITDQIFDTLAKLSKLKVVETHGTRVTSSGRARYLNAKLDVPRQ